MYFFSLKVSKLNKLLTVAQVQPTPLPSSPFKPTHKRSRAESIYEILLHACAVMWAQLLYTFCFLFFDFVFVHFLFFARLFFKILWLASLSFIRCTFFRAHNCRECGKKSAREREREKEGEQLQNSAREKWKSLRFVLHEKNFCISVVMKLEHSEKSWYTKKKKESQKKLKKICQKEKGKQQATFCC